MIRGDSAKKQIAIVFTGDEYGEGLKTIERSLRTKNIKASFFFTGRFYRNKQFVPYLQQLAAQGHYFGPHSDQHLLYNDWTKRDSTLITQTQFEKDIADNITAMKKAGIDYRNPKYFIPPYEWWNDTIAAWSKKMNLNIFSFTPGTFTNADYTWPELGIQYRSNEWLLNKLDSLVSTTNMSGNILLIHAGTDPRRKKKLYENLEQIIEKFQSRGYKFKTIEQLLKD